MRIDRRCWARAIDQGKCTWGFKGVANPSHRDMKHLLHGPRRDPVHVQIVLADEQFMDNVHYEEAKYVATSEDYKDEWEKHVKDLIHREGCCPHGHAEERTGYQHALSTVMNSEDARFAWASEYVDGEWVRNSVWCLLDNEESLFYWVKDHPVDSVWQPQDAKWLSLDDVHGYCPSCDTPLAEDRRWEPVAGVGYTCGSCDWIGDTADAAWFITTYGRPFNWPPGAPYPPRRSFSGSPMDVPPYED